MRSLQYRRNKSVDVIRKLLIVDEESTALAFSNKRISLICLEWDIRLVTI